MINGTREGIRTPDLWYRKPTLYPAELRAHDSHVWPNAYYNRLAQAIW